MASRIQPGLFLLLLLLAAFTLRGHAQSLQLHVYGAGALTCDRWTSDRAAGGEDFRVQLSWVLGFVTAFQWSSGDGMQDADVTGIDAFITTYCADHPLHTVSDAASSLVAELKFRGTAP